MDFWTKVKFLLHCGFVKSRAFLCLEALTWDLEGGYFSSLSSLFMA